MTQFSRQRDFLPGLSICVAIAMLVSIAALIRTAIARPLDQSAAPTASTAANYPNCRFGVGGAVNAYAVSALNLGWYMDWGAQPDPARPNGAEYAQVVRLKPDFGRTYTFTPSITVMYSIADQNPGAVWLIGNEPDSPFQDSLFADVYAHAYHDLYQLIKQRDPAARIGVGSIVQPTPLRLQYLDQVLSAYQTSYGTRLPTDLWSTHSYILREIDPSDPDVLNGTLELWGAYIPPGFTTKRGELYSYAAMFDVNLFRQRLVDFRNWLAARGYRNTPLYITEYGTLFPYNYIDDEHGIPMTEARTSAFMTATFNILLNLADASIGYPADGNRLVQRWLWYSFDDPSYGGPLFDPATGLRRPLGDVFAAYTQAISPSVDLLAVNLIAEAVPVGAGGTATATLQATLSNVGNISVTQPITLEFRAGSPPSGALIGAAVITRSMPGCAATARVTTQWTGLSAGKHAFYVSIDPTNAISETTESNNQLAGNVFVATYQLLLPTISR